MDILDRVFDQLKLLSFDSADLSPEIIKEHTPQLNEFILEITNIKKKVKEPNCDQETVMNFKRLVDVLRLYKNPVIFDLLNQCKAEREIEKERQELIAKNRNENRLFRNESVNNRYNTYDTDFSFNGSSYSNFWDTTDNLDLWGRHEDELDNDDVSSNLSATDLRQTEFEQMLDDAYGTINNNSILVKMYGMTRRAICVVDESDIEDEDENDDADKVEN